MYGEEVGSRMFTNVNSDLAALFDDYVSLYSSSSASDTYASQSSQPSPLPTSQATTKTLSLTKERFKKHKQESGMGGGKKQILIFIWLRQWLVEA